MCMLGAPVAGHLEDCDTVQYINATQAALKLQEQNAYMRKSMSASNGTH